MSDTHNTNSDSSKIKRFRLLIRRIRLDQLNLNRKEDIKALKDNSHLSPEDRIIQITIGHEDQSYESLISKQSSPDTKHVIFYENSSIIERKLSTEQEETFNKFYSAFERLSPEGNVYPFDYENNLNFQQELIDACKLIAERNTRNKEISEHEIPYFLNMKIINAEILKVPHQIVVIHRANKKGYPVHGIVTAKNNSQPRTRNISRPQQNPSARKTQRRNSGPDRGTRLSNPKEKF